MKKKKITKPQMVFTTLTDLSEQLMCAMVTAGMRGMPNSVMVFCTMTTMAKLLKMKGVSDENVAEMFTTGFNSYVKLDKHMSEILRGMNQ